MECDRFADLREAVGATLSWTYVRILRPQIHLKDRSTKRLYMQFSRSSPFSMRRTDVEYSGVRAAIDMQLTGSSWISWLPIFGQSVRDFYTLSESSGRMLATTTGVTNDPVNIAVGAELFHYRRINVGRHHMCILDHQGGEVITGRGGSVKMNIVRWMNEMPEALAMYWLIRLCDWDGYES
jgi:hypothetical protein